MRGRWGEKEGKRERRKGGRKERRGKEEKGKRKREKRECIPHSLSIVLWNNFQVEIIFLIYRVTGTWCRNPTLKTLEKHWLWSLKQKVSPKCRLLNFHNDWTKQKPFQRFPSYPPSWAHWRHLRAFQVCVVCPQDPLRLLGSQELRKPMSDYFLNTLSSPPKKLSNSLKFLIMFPAGHWAWEADSSEPRLSEWPTLLPPHLFICLSPKWDASCLELVTVIAWPQLSALYARGTL